MHHAPGRGGSLPGWLKGGEIHVGDEVTLLPPPEDPPLRAAVITLSDKGSRGEREDKSGPLIVEMLTAAGYVVEETMLLPDEAKALKAQLIRLADGRQVNLILTTGGTGFAPRDITPEATYAVADRNAPGIAEAMRYHSLSITPRGMLSRAASVLRGKTLIVNLPGSPQGREGESGVHPAQPGARGAHCRRAGRRVRPQISLFHRRGVAFGAGRENKSTTKAYPL